MAVCVIRALFVDNAGNKIKSKRRVDAVAFTLSEAEYPVDEADYFIGNVGHKEFDRKKMYLCSRDVKLGQVCTCFRAYTNKKQYLCVGFDEYAHKVRKYSFFCSFMHLQS